MAGRLASDEGKRGEETRQTGTENFLRHPRGEETRGKRGENGGVAGACRTLIVAVSTRFLDASSHLYKRPCPSVGRSVRPLVRRSVTLLSNSVKNGLLRILNDSDSSGRGRKRDKEERRTRRKERRGGRSDEEEGATRRVKK